MVQKFNFLKNSLTDEAPSVITYVNVSEENYIVAWELFKNGTTNYDI